MSKDFESREATPGEELTLTRKGLKNQRRLAAEWEARWKAALDDTRKWKARCQDLSDDLIEAQAEALQESQRADRAEAGWTEAERWHLDRLTITAKSSATLYWKGGGSSDFINGDTEEATYNFRDRIPPEPAADVVDHPGRVIPVEDGPDVRVFTEADVQQMSVDLPYWKGAAKGWQKRAEEAEAELERINSDRPYCLPWWKANAERWQEKATALEGKTAEAVKEAQELRSENIRLSAQVNQYPKLVELRTENAELQDKTRVYLRTIQELNKMLAEAEDPDDDGKAANPLADDYHDLYDKWVVLRQKLAKCEEAREENDGTAREALRLLSERTAELEQCQSEAKSLDDNLTKAIRERQAAGAEVNALDDEVKRYRSLCDALAAEGWFFDHDSYEGEESR